VAATWHGDPANLDDSTKSRAGDRPRGDDPKSSSSPRGRFALRNWRARL
jgi:hypothetical protein